MKYGEEKKPQSVQQKEESKSLRPLGVKGERGPSRSNSAKKTTLDKKKKIKKNKSKAKEKKQKK